MYKLLLLTLLISCGSSSPTIIIPPVITVPHPSDTSSTIPPVIIIPDSTIISNPDTGANYHYESIFTDYQTLITDDYNDNSDIKTNDTAFNGIDTHVIQDSVSTIINVVFKGTVYTITAHQDSSQLLISASTQSITLIPQSINIAVATSEYPCVIKIPIEITSQDTVTYQNQLPDRYRDE